jgi:hypothetical protein
MPKRMCSHQRGSVFILVIVAALILSLLGMAGLRRVGVDLKTARNYVEDKSTFYAADAGICYGIEHIDKQIDPSTVRFQIGFGRRTFFRSGPIEEEEAQPVKPFKGFVAPPAIGMSIEMGSEIGMVSNLWRLQVTSVSEKKETYYDKKIARPGRKEIETLILSMSAEY